MEISVTIPQVGSLANPAAITAVARGAEAAGFRGVLVQLAR
jgi:hypothetical protein